MESLTWRRDEVELLIPQQRDPAGLLERNVEAKIIAFVLFVHFKLLKVCTF